MNKLMTMNMDDMFQPNWSTSRLHLLGLSVLTFQNGPLSAVAHTAHSNPSFTDSAQLLLYREIQPSGLNNPVSVQWHGD